MTQFWSTQNLYDQSTTPGFQSMHNAYHCPAPYLVWRLMYLLGMTTHVRLHTGSGREPTNENEERAY
jgi:hypothetical protein